MFVVTMISGRSGPSAEPAQPARARDAATVSGKNTPAEPVVDEVLVAMTASPEPGTVPRIDGVPR